MPSQIIAQALYTLVKAQCEAGVTNLSGRMFIRLDGFDDAYADLIARLRSTGLLLAGRPLTILTTASITGCEEFALKDDQTATWHRNHLEPGHILLLIFNRPTSDAQSLKDIFAVNETLLVGEKGLPHLIQAAFYDGYQLNQEDEGKLRSFVDRFTYAIALPQLRDLARFLSQVNHLMVQESKRIYEAIGEALPYLGLFCDSELIEALGNRAKTEKRLRELYQAARLGSELLSEGDQRAYVERLDKAKDDFDDDSPYGGKTPEQKYQLLRRFLLEVIPNNSARLEVLTIDWREVRNVLFKPPKPTQPERLRTLAEAMQNRLSIDDLPDYAQDIVHDLNNGVMPDADSIERLVTEDKDQIGKTLARQIGRLVKQRSYAGTDFIAELMAATVDLATEYRAEISQGASLHVIFRAIENSEDDFEVANAFLALYGGVEKIFPSITWDFQDLWRIEKEQHEGPSKEDSERDLEKIQTAILIFRLRLCSADGSDVAQADLKWEYPPDSPAAATFRAFNKMKLEHQKRGSFIPVFNTGRAEDSISDLDLRHPLRTLGAWLDTPGSLRQMMQEALNRSAISRDVARAIDAELSSLELAWTDLVDQVLDSGLLAANVDKLLDVYEQTLRTLAERLRLAQEVLYGYRTLARAWMVGPEHFEEWAIVPMLHPLKLLWWRNRASQFAAFISRLFASDFPADLVDSVRFRKGLGQTYGSSGFPAILVLPDRTGQPMNFLPLDEIEGYELFRPADRAGAAQGLDADLVSPQEAEEEAAKAADSLARVVDDYLQTYPFVKDGIEIYLIGCRNGALPGQLVEQIGRYQKRHKNAGDIRVSVVVHTQDRGAPLFARVTMWLKSHEEYIERPSEDYFPVVTLRVLECDYDELRIRLYTRGGEPIPLARDIVILADMLSERGQAVQGSLTSLVEPDMPRDQFVPFSPLYRSLPLPFQKGELARDVLLNPAPMPTVARLFYNSQWAFYDRRACSSEQMVEFHQRYSLDPWSELLEDLHHTFNWVLCYDNAIDRFLLEDTLPEHVHVIRYSLGLGVKGRHNLTVSSSYWAQQVVVRRLTARLKELLPNAPEPLRLAIAEQLVNEAKAISGDIVLRAAGPGSYLNELIGVVLSKYITEQSYSEQHPGALKAWIYLDDFGHWFSSGKKPDMLFLAIPQEANGALPLHVEIIEAKCVGDTSFVDEAADAERQVQRGVNRLGPAWAAEGRHLDASYWYDQLYRALVGNLSIPTEQMRLWEALRHRLPRGNFALEMSGHSWIFCYDGRGTTTTQQPVTETSSDLTADDAPRVLLKRHHFGQRGVVNALKSLVEKWNIPASPDTWQPPQTPEHTPTQGPDAPQSIIKLEVEEPESTQESQPLPIIEPQPVPDWLAEQAHQLDRALRQYHINAFPIELDIANIGPSIVRYKVRLRPGEPDARLKKIANDLARELALHETPIIDRLPGTQYIAVDVPRIERESVLLTPALADLPPISAGALPFLVGKTPSGETVTRDLALLPHLLVAGTTGSGKTVFLYGLLVSLLYQFTAEQVSIVLIDPKQTDFVFFQGLAHLRDRQIINDPEAAIEHLRQLTGEELEMRTTALQEARVVKLADYNMSYPDRPLIPIVVIVDEYADLIDVMNKTEREIFEREIRRLAQRARSVGIHLVIATQRPSANIVTSSLKTNLPARIAFRLPAHQDSMVILDQSGAENLLGRGDMLFLADGRLERLQGFYINPTQIDEFLRSRRLIPPRRK